MKRILSKGLGWVITLALWFAIATLFTLIFDEPVTSLPFWAYFVVVFLCVAAMSIVNHFVKNKPEDDNTSIDKGESMDGGNNR